MKLLLISENFPPERNAPANRSFEHAKVWVERGHAVEVITCAPNFPAGKVFPGFKNRWHSVEKIKGVVVHRVWTLIFPNRGIFLRLLDFWSFVKASSLCGLFLKTDVIMTTSPQFFVNFTGYFLKLCKRKPWVLEIRDLWPESASSVGVIKNSLLLRMAAAFELYFYRHADLVVVVTEGIKKNLVTRGISSKKIIVATNGVDLSAFSFKAKAENDKIRIAYVGTLGSAHRLDFLIQSIRRLESESMERAQKFSWAVVGDGAERERLLEMSSVLSTRTLEITKPMEHSEVPRFLSSLDWGFVHLRKTPTFLSALPSKIFELAAAGVPILLGVDGEARALIEKYGAGLYFEPENEQSLLEAIHRIEALGAAEWKQFSKGALKLAADFDRNKIAAELIDKIAVTLKQ